MLPSPSAIILEFFSASQMYLQNAWFTLYEIGLGFMLALVIAVPLAIMIVYSDILQNTVYPILVVLQSVPKVALAPLIVMWFLRVNMTLPIIIVTFLICFFPIVVDTTTGLMTISSELMDLARSLRAPAYRIFFKMRLPNALPNFFAGVKVAVTFAVVGAVVGEFVGGNKGLGYLILFLSSQMITKGVFVSLALLSLMGVCLFEIVALIEKATIPWAYYKEE
jgi:NitT/TauT family transport system permease protein